MCACAAAVKSAQPCELLVPSPESDGRIYHPDQASAQSTPLVLNRECKRGLGTSTEHGSRVMRVGREAIVSKAES